MPAMLPPLRAEFTCCLDNGSAEEDNTGLPPHVAPPDADRRRDRRELYKRACALSRPERLFANTFASGNEKVKLVKLKVSK